MDDTAEEVILVDENDVEIGVAAKLPAHRRGYLHRAVSVFVLDGAGRMLLQRRAAGKYHSAGQWANACCSHPRPGEAPQPAAERRLREELGFSCALRPRGVTIYRADVGAGLIEHELVHLFAGVHRGEVAPDPREADAVAWVTQDDLRRDMAAAPESYAPWFRHYAQALGDSLFDV
jgi:isopentenyl-diphosphate Delta-isomerase